MPLNKATKTVLFSEGMGDGTDRFLLESPAVDYAHNLRIDKQGSLQKRPGFGPDALATVPNANGDPFFIHAIGNNLHVITEDGARSWDGNTDSWRETDAAGFVGTSSVEIESQNFVGLGNCAFLPYLAFGTSDISGYALAYEVREENSDTDYTVDSVKHVVLQRYDADKRFIDQRRYDGTRSPRLVRGPGGQVTMFLQHIASNDLRWIQSDMSFVVIPPVPQSLGISVSDYPRMQHYAPLDQGPRLGQGVYGQARYFVEYSDLTNNYYILYTHNAGVGVYMRQIRTDGTIVDSATIRDDSDTDILALHVYEEGVIVLYQWWDTEPEVTPGTPIGTGVWEVIIERYHLGDINGGPNVVYEIDFGQSYTEAPAYSHATIATDFLPSASKVFLAMHYSGKNSRSMQLSQTAPDPDYQGSAHYWYPYNVRAQDTRLRTWEWTIDTEAPAAMNASLHAHRLTTNAVRHDGKWYAGVQQWLDHTPIHINPGDINAYVNVEAAAKPVTTALCVFTKNEPVRPVASLDAGMSGHVDYAESEVAIHLGTLVSDGDDLLVSNRVKLRAEDCSFYFGARTSSWRRTSNVEVGSDSLCRVHRVKKGDRELTAAPFGDGVALSTGVPMWFDGNFFAEFGPLDSPEILRVEDADYSNSTVGRPGSDAMYSAPCQGYQEMPGDTLNVDFRKFSAVVGYVDSRGNTHRSAPSATYWVGDVEEGRDVHTVGSVEAWSGREVTVWVTTPLTVLPENVDYFVEVYVSTDADTDMQLAAQAAIDMRSTGNNTNLTFQLNRAVEDDTGTTKVLLRSTRPVYTSGSVLAADPWPSFKNFVVQSTRFWAIDSTNKGRVIYSKLFEDFLAPEYNPTLSINLGDERDLTAIGKLDDKVVVFEPDDIHIIYGEGPDNRGQGQDFAVHYISTDVGCEDQESVIETPVGLIFYSKPRGFYLLDRNLQVQFIGEGIEDTAFDINILSATLVRDKAEVRFAYTGGPDPDDRLGPDIGTSAIERPPRPVFTNVGGADPALTFNYERNTWMTYSNYDAQAATIYQGKYTMLRSNWDIWQETDDRWDDPSGLSLTSIMTPWIKLSENIQGFNRLWRMTILGRYLSSLQDMGFESGPYIFDEKVGTGGGFASGEVRFNAVNLIDATICRIQNIDANGEDRTALWGSVAGADVSVLSDAGNGCVFQCSTTTDAGAFHELDIAPGSVVISGDPLVDLDEVTATPQIPTYEGGDLQVKVYFDYEAEPAQTKLFRIQDFGYDPFNNPEKRAERFQMEITPIRGRCQAVKLEFSELLSESIAEGIAYKQGRGFEVVATDFHVGIQPSKTLIPQRSKK